MANASLKKQLMEQKLPFIANFDFTSILSMRDSCMLNYLIDLDDYKNLCGRETELTPAYIQLKRPNWSKYDIRESLKLLSNLGLIVKGSNHGRGNYYKVCEEKILELTNLDESAYQNLVSRLSDFDKQITKNEQQSITNQKQIKNNNIYSEEIKEIIDYLNNKTNSRYRYNTESTNRLIRARLKDGYVVDDFRKVIDIKFNEWAGTEFEKFLRPSTLFSTSHFEQYLNQKVVKSNAYKPMHELTYSVEATANNINFDKWY